MSSFSNHAPFTRRVPTIIGYEFLIETAELIIINVEAIAASSIEKINISGIT